jgi:hypothetical protein
MPNSIQEKIITVVDERLSLNEDGLYWRKGRTSSLGVNIRFYD